MKRYALVVSLNLTKEDIDDPDPPSSSLPRVRQRTHLVKNGHNRYRKEPAVPMPLRGGGASKGACSCPPDAEGAGSTGFRVLPDLFVPAHVRVAVENHKVRLIRFEGIRIVGGLLQSLFDDGVQGAA
jgi:hypothetical protein